MSKLLVIAGCLAVTLVAAASSAVADSRVERPLQLQFDLSGVSIGYHFSELVYVGLTQQSSVKTQEVGCLHCNDEEKSRIYDQNRVDTAKYDYGVRRSLEFRFSPWESGIYFALGALAADIDGQDVVYEEAPRVVGDSAYNSTGMRLQVESKSYTGIVAGMGINHVFDFGLSIGFGFVTGLTQEEAPDIVVTSFGSDPASDEDLEKFKDTVEEEYLGPPTVGMLHLAIGYNF